MRPAGVLKMSLFHELRKCIKMIQQLLSISPFCALPRFKSLHLCMIRPNPGYVSTSNTIDIAFRCCDNSGSEVGNKQENILQGANWENVKDLSDFIKTININLIKNAAGPICAWGFVCSRCGWHLWFCCFMNSDVRQPRLSLRELTHALFTSDRYGDKKFQFCYHMHSPTKFLARSPQLFLPICKWVDALEDVFSTVWEWSMITVEQNTIHDSLLRGRRGSVLRGGPSRSDASQRAWQKKCLIHMPFRNSILLIMQTPCFLRNWLHQRIQHVQITFRDSLPGFSKVEACFHTCIPPTAIDSVTTAYISSITLWRLRNFSNVDLAMLSHRYVNF